MAQQLPTENEHRYFYYYEQVWSLPITLLLFRPFSEAYKLLQELSKEHPTICSMLSHVHRIIWPIHTFAG